MDYTDVWVNHAVKTKMAPLLEWHRGRKQKWLIAWSNPSTNKLKTWRAINMEFENVTYI